MATRGPLLRRLTSLVRGLRGNATRASADAPATAGDRAGGSGCLTSSRELLRRLSPQDGTPRNSTGTQHPWPVPGICLPLALQQQDAVPAVGSSALPHRAGPSALLLRPDPAEGAPAGRRSEDGAATEEGNGVLLPACPPAHLGSLWAHLEAGVLGPHCGMQLTAVPKRKVTPSRRGMRNGPKALKPTPAIVQCRACGRIKLPHLYCCEQGHSLKQVHQQLVHQRWKTLLPTSVAKDAQRIAAPLGEQHAQTQE